MSEEELLTKEDVLGGLPSGRARTLLFLIESKTAHMKARSQQAMDTSLTEDGERRRDAAFLQAFTLGRDPPLRPRIQDLERYAPVWAHLVPDNPRVRAALARALGAKYRLSYGRTPRIRRALRLDGDAVRDAYQAQFGDPIATLYARDEPLSERVRWALTGFADRLEALPPFWTAFSLTLTETAGAGILALPIALSRVGPIPALILLIVFGIVNVLTIAAMAETITRTGSVRYRSAFFGRVIAEYLGGLGSAFASVAMLAVNVASLLAFYIGFALVMRDVTGLPSNIWAAAFFVVGVYFLTRGSLSSTVASSLVVGGINIALIVALSVLSLTRLQPTNLAYVAVPFVNGRPFEPQYLELIFRRRPHGLFWP